MNALQEAQNSILDPHGQGSAEMRENPEAAAKQAEVIRLHAAKLAGKAAAEAQVNKQLPNSGSSPEA